MSFQANLQKWLGVAVILAATCLVQTPASAGLVCAAGTAGFGWTRPGIFNDSGLGACSITNLGLSFLLADGLSLSFDINESITGNVGPTTSAYIRITNLVAKNVGLGAINDNIYFLSDVFNPSAPGTAGVGATGIYGAVGGGVAPVGGVYASSSQAQMNFLLVPIFGLELAPGFALTTPPTFAIGNPGLPFTFYESARTPFLGGGLVQLVGGLNFHLTSGSEVYLPGSVIVDANTAAAFLSEVPEPGSIVLLSSGLLALVTKIRLRKRA